MLTFSLYLIVHWTSDKNFPLFLLLKCICCYFSQLICQIICISTRPKEFCIVIDFVFVLFSFFTFLFQVYTFLRNVIVEIKIYLKYFLLVVIEQLFSFIIYFLVRHSFLLSFLKPYVCIPERLVMLNLYIWREADELYVIIDSHQQNKFFARLLCL